MGLRERLITAGVEVLERDGLPGLTLRAAAREAGVSHGAPRHEFPTFALLLAAIAREGIVDLDHRLESIAEGAARERLLAIARHYVAFAEERPAMFELMFRHDLLEGSGLRLRETSAPMVRRFQTVVNEVGGDASAALGLWAALHGIGVLHVRGAWSAVAPHADVAVLIERAVAAYLP